MQNNLPSKSAMWNKWLHRRKASLALPLPFLSGTYISSPTLLSVLQKSNKKFRVIYCKCVCRRAAILHRRRAHRLPWHLVRFTDQGVAADSMDV